MAQFPFYGRAAVLGAQRPERLQHWGAEQKGVKVGWCQQEALLSESWNSAVLTSFKPS